MTSIDIQQRYKDLSPEKRVLLARKLAEKAKAETEEQTISIRPDLEQRPLSFAQQRLWFLNQLEPESPYYNIPAAIELSGELNVAALAWGLDQVIIRHEVLRTYFITEQGHPKQLVYAELTLNPDVVELTDLPAEERWAKAMGLAGEEAARPFDLTTGPLIRACLLRLASDHHILLLTIHHIAFDELSTAIVLQEVAAAYSAYQQEADLPLSDLPIQYADFAHWQRQQLQDKELERQLGYWRDQLGDPPPLLELPLDRPRPPVQTYAGTTLTVELSPEILPGLKALSKQENATLFMVLLAAYQVLLARYSGQHDISVGTPIANRKRQELESLVGFFTNTLVLRSDLSANPTFRQFFQQVRERALGAYAHQDLPFEMLVDELQPQRHLNYTPFFQTVFALQNAPLRSLQLGDLRLRLIEAESTTAKFDLLLMMEEQVDQLKAVFEYNTDLFKADTIQRLARSWQNLLLAIVADPDQRVSDLQVVDAEEQRRILIEWNDTKSDYPGDRTVVELFEQQVECSPLAVALVFDEQTLTYNELNRRANQVAHHLRSLGVGPDSLVGLFFERNLDMVVATLAILKAGGAYLPLDPKFPAERLSFMLADGDVSILLTHDHLRDQITDAPVMVLCLDSDQDRFTDESGENLPVRIGPDNLAYVMYTSGSTGRPKGVCVTHANILRLVKGSDYISFDRDQVFLQLAPISFDAATLELWGPLLNGAKLVIMPLEAPTLAEIGDIIASQGITTLWLTAGLFHLMIEERADDLRSVRQLLAGGDVLSVSHVQKALSMLDDGVLVNGYGPTENTTFSTCHPMTPGTAIGMTVPIGRPIANTQVFIFDRQMQPVPVGVPGELYLGGDGLARGYLNHPTLTAERFVPHPVATAPGERLYKTGDRVRWLSDGAIEFLGRFDFQVKIRGFRIEPGEIEVVLDQHPLVDQMVVMAREDAPGDRRLVGYVKPKNDSGLTASDLRPYLKSKLPDYMVPAAFVFVDSFPLNPNGKIDRAQLPMPGLSRDISTASFVAPRNKVEQFLAEKFTEVLGLEQVGIHDNFFELGGDSLKAAVLINRWQEEMQQTAHVRALFQAPTIAELAAYMVEYYPDAASAVSREQDITDAAISLEEDISSVSELLDEQKINRFRQIIPALPPRALGTYPAEKNPPAVFILSPPRSGSTLLRVMLEGHPQLFSPPELDLLTFNTLAERREAFTGGYEFWLEGVLRAITEATGIGAAEAEEMMSSFEQQGMSTKSFYRQLQNWIGDRLLVDKTPVYALDNNILERAEQDFDNVRYIHLVRHPYGSIYSFIEARLDELFFRHEHPFERRELAELIWVVSHENILGFLSHVPPSRQYRLYFEDLVQRPQQTMLDLSRFLRFDYVDDMLHPYDKDRMTTGLRDGQQMVGDFKFYLRRQIDPGVVDRWQRFHTEDFLSEHARGIASSLGYGLTSHHSQSQVTWTRIETLDRIGDLPLSYAQQRLWFLDQFDPGQSTYNVPLAVDLAGELDQAVLDQALSEIVRRHEVIHTTIASEDGQPRVVIHAPVPVNTDLVDLRQISEEQRRQTTSALVDEEARRPFDLAHDHMMRARLLCLADDKHVLLITFHHIAFDGWSSTIFVREFVELYEAYRSGLPSPLPELSVQYVDFAHWQRGWLQSGFLAKQLNYWRQQLDGAPAMLNLPTDHPRPAVQTTRGARYTFRVDETLTTAINELSRKEGVTLFMTLLAAFQVLLSRYSGQDDVCVGTPIANRTRQEIEPLIGFFSNTLTIRSDLSRDKTFHQFLDQVRRAAVEAYVNQDIPFEMLVDELRPQRDTSTTPFFQVMFSLQESFRKQVELPGLTVTPIEPESGSAKFDINLSVIDRRSLRCVLEYNTDLFDRATIERMAEHFQILLDGIVSSPHQQLSLLPLIAKAEQHTVLIDWNNTDTDADLVRSIHQLVEKQVIRTPDAIALIVGQKRISYRELNERANQLAHYLLRLGIGPESLVGICMDRSEWMVVGLLGILKAGGAYVSLDPAYPKSRLAYMMEEARVSVLLTLDALREYLPEQDAVMVCLDQDWEQIADEPRSNLQDLAISRNLAYVLFTSGSTGRPKGVAIEHTSAVALIEWAIRVYSAEELAGVLAVTSINFDLSVYELFVTLSSGGAIILADDALSLPTLPAAAEVTLINTVPSAIRELLNLHAVPDNVRTVNLAGEPLLAEVVDQLYALPSIDRVYDLYGPSEDTTYSTYVQRWPKGPEIIGKPLDNTGAYVLDRNMKPTPIGVPGELYLGGAGLARGYLHQPAQTAARFVPDPFSGEHGERLYKTGDLARYKLDGNIEFMGRIDHQVKIRGFRIELPEIEFVLRNHENIAQTVLLAREDSGMKRLVAYCVPVHQPAPSVSELRVFMRDKLPEYMLPSVFVMLETMPMTPNGKVDRGALPAPDTERPELATVHVSPRTAEEAALVGVWGEVLSMTDIGVQDNFFELGGDSITSIQVISRAQRLGLMITPRQLFQYPTIAGLAQVAERGMVVKAEQGLVEGETPLTPIQHWFFEQGFEKPEHWNQSILLTVEAPLQVDLLQEAFTNLLRHHDALRMHYIQGSDGWMQFNAGEPITAPVEVIDLSVVAYDEYTRVIEDHCARLQASLDLSTGPLVRVAYFDLGAESPGRLFIAIHHLVIDGVSWRILMEDLRTLYAQLAAGRKPLLSPKTTSYRQWALAQIDYANSPEVQAEVEFWLNSIPTTVPVLPVDDVCESNIEAALSHISISLTAAETTLLLRSVPAFFDAHINDILLSALALAVEKWMGQPYVYLHMEGHGREALFDDIDTSRTVGWFTTLYPLFLALPESDDVVQSVQAIAAQMRALPQRGIGYGLLRYLSSDLQIREQLSSLPAPQLSFNYLGQFDQGVDADSGFSLANESKGFERSPDAERLHLLDVTASVVEGQFCMEWLYNRSIHLHATIEQLAQNYLTALRLLLGAVPDDGTTSHISAVADVELSTDDFDAILAEIEEL